MSFSYRWRRVRFGTRKRTLILSPLSQNLELRIEHVEIAISYPLAKRYTSRAHRVSFTQRIPPCLLPLSLAQITAGPLSIHRCIRRIRSTLYMTLSLHAVSTHCCACTRTNASPHPPSHHSLHTTGPVARKRCSFLFFFFFFFSVSLSMFFFFFFSFFGRGGRGRVP